MQSTISPPAFGNLLRTWRQRRRLSQLELAVDAEISTRHLSFLETGRAQPSREMLLRLAEYLEIPLRERNQLLVAAGFAPLFPERSLDDPALGAARAAVEKILAAHVPVPALALDRGWNMVAANAMIGPLLEGLAPAVVAPPVNVLRLSLRPDGLAPRIANGRQWRAHLLARLARQIELTADPALVELDAELRSYPVPGIQEHSLPVDPASDVAVPLQLRHGAETLSFFSTTMVFGTPIDITLAELAIESFFPADARTAEHLGRIAAAVGAEPGRAAAPVPLPSTWDQTRN